jgi:2,4-dienoyl-CoA reductase-like NADH-dependent reductase (Old Yellow Enzyme family)
MESNDAVDGGKVSERTIQKYVQLAKGGWGIIIVEAISITPKS